MAKVTKNTVSSEEREMKFERFGKDEATILQIELDEAVQEILSRHGINLAGNSAVMDVSGAEVKVSLTFKAGDADRLAFEQYATQVYLEPSDFGAEFQRGGKTYKIVGLKLSGKGSHATPIICSPVVDGKVGEERYVLAIKDVAKGLGREVPEWV